MQLDFNPEPPRIMFIDLNSCFATIEQQAHPQLRGRPMGVTNRISRSCCVIACSYEAKALGIKTGMRLDEARMICPSFVMLETDPPKYHHVYQKLAAIMRDYSPDVKMKSIDEGVIDFHSVNGITKRPLETIAREIKQRLKDEVGIWMTCSIGIAPNRFLAKQASNYRKPDGLFTIDQSNYLNVYKSQQLTDLSGIASRFEARLNSYGIRTPLEFYNAPERVLHKAVFHSIMGLHWYRKLRGYETDDYETHLGMVGRQWVVAKPTDNEDYILPCLHLLAETTGMKVRYKGVVARGITVWCRFQTGESWYNKKMFHSTFYSNQEIWRRTLLLFNQRPKHMVIQTIGITCYQLEPSNRNQASLLEEVNKEEWLTTAMDEINDFYGKFTVYSAHTLPGTHLVKQKIPFGGTQYFDLLLKRQ